MIGCTSITMHGDFIMLISKKKGGGIKNLRLPFQNVRELKILLPVFLTLCKIIWGK